VTELLLNPSFVQQWLELIRILLDPFENFDGQVTATRVTHQVNFTGAAFADLFLNPPASEGFADLE
jgi:hypothetical protein